MDAIEKRARELLAAEIERDGFTHAAEWIRDPSKSLRHIEAEAIRAIIAALTPQWQPIESAPKDGTPILACYAPHYETNGFLPVAVRWRAYHPNARGNEEWRDSSGAKVRAITHWQPLPAPPEVG